MLKNARNCLFILLVLALLASPGCGPSKPSQATSPIKITDQRGRVVTLPGIPRRIISLAPSNTEILFALGLGDKVVGVTDYDNYPPEATQKTSIGGFSNPNMEKIVSLSPDLILAAPLYEQNVIPYFEGRGIPILVLAPTTLDEILASINLVGKATGTEEKASELVTAMSNRIKAVTDRTARLTDDKRPRVFYLVWHDPLMAEGVGSLSNELIQKAGGKNIFADIDNTQAITLESVVARNPQLMIAATNMGTEGEPILDYLKTESRLQDTEAGKNKRIYGISVDLTGRAGPRIVDGLEAFARCIHPEIFSPSDNK